MPDHKTTAERIKAFYICGTHWDREWYEPFQEYRLWLVQNMDRILDRLRDDPRLRVFHLDGQAILLEDYLEIRPERKDELAGMLKQGRLVAGPWFVPPDLWLVSGEALIRNLNLGMRIVRSLGAAPMRTGYTPDLFGHLGSMPMIFAGLGLESTIVWRGLNDDQVKAQFIWKGPDGSGVLCHKLPDHCGYPWFAARLRWDWTNNGQDKAVMGAKAPAVLGEERGRLAAPVMYLSDAGDHQTMPDRIPEMLDCLRQAVPEMDFIHGSIDEYFDEVAKHRHALVEFSGELRYPARRTGTPWHAMIPHCPSARVPLKQANDRGQSLLTLWAEPLAALAALEGRALPPGFLSTAWHWLLQNHPHDSICGCSIDETHADMAFRFHQAEKLGDGVRRQGMALLSAPSLMVSKTGGSTVVWNPLAWERREVCELDLLFPSDFPAKAQRSGHTGPVQNQFELIDPEGRSLPFQVLSIDTGKSVKSVDEQGRRRAAGTGLEIYRVAVCLDLPAAGFTTLTVKPCDGIGSVKRFDGSLRTGLLQAENGLVKLTVRPDGTAEIVDLASGRAFRDLFLYEERGDAGDGWNFVPPMADIVMVSPGHAATCSVAEEGPLQVTFRIDRVFRIPAGLEPGQVDRRSDERVEMQVTDFLTLRAGDPQVRVRTVVENNARDHRLRVLFPTDLPAVDYWSDQPFYWARRPVALDPLSHTYKEPDPVERPHHTVLAVEAEQAGLAVLCPEGLHEHSVLDEARRTMALTLFRGVAKTPTTDGEPGPQVQGRLEFRYALLPYQGGLDKAGALRRVMGLQAGVMSHMTERPTGRKSFLRVESGEHVVVSAVKPGQDGKSIVVRLWNTGPVEAEASITTGAASGQAELCDLKEDPIGKASWSKGHVCVAVKPGGLTTVRLAT